jgi:hypothetical protein
MHANRARLHPSPELFLYIAYVVSGDTTDAKSTETGWFSSRLQTTDMPELRKAHVANKAGARLQSPLPQVRAPGLHLPRMRRADCAHHGSRRQSFEIIAWPRRAVRRRHEEDGGRRPTVPTKMSNVSFSSVNRRSEKAGIRSVDREDSFRLAVDRPCCQRNRLVFRLGDDTRQLAVE